MPLFLLGLFGVGAYFAAKHFYPAPAKQAAPAAPPLALPAAPTAPAAAPATPAAKQAAADSTVVNAALETLQAQGVPIVEAAAAAIPAPVQDVAQQAQTVAMPTLNQVAAAASSNLGTLLGR